jgi:ABC-type glycerol-3-phosphate transport system substrate-binding protein
MMKMPVLSAIVEKLEYRDGENFMSDEMLAQVIQAIDGGATTYDGVSANDMARLTEARNIVTGWGFGHVGYIPVYSDKKDLAKDFLYFMVSDEGQRIFTEATKGSTQPYEFDYLNDSRTSAVMNDFAKGVYKIVKESDVRAYEIAKDPIFAYGGLTISYTWTETSILTAFTAEPGTKNYMNAEQYYAYRYDFYNNKWENILSQAGIQ